MLQRWHQVYDLEFYTKFSQRKARCLKHANWTFSMSFLKSGTSCNHLFMGVSHPMSSHFINQLLLSLVRCNQKYAGVICRLLQIIDTVPIRQMTWLVLTGTSGYHIC